jgi:hypothetical protein
MRRGNEKGGMAPAGMLGATVKRRSECDFKEPVEKIVTVMMGFVR